MAPAGRHLEAPEALRDDVRAALGARVISDVTAFDEFTIHVAADDIVATVTALRDDRALRFVSFVDICGVDWPGREARFDVVYHFLSPTRNARIRVKVAVGEGASVPSISDVFPAATWFEREAYDLYGILFAGNPDLRRILTDYGFRGHPLRKDFPLTGFVEVRYDNGQRRVVYEPVKLAQEFRNFDFLSPWEGTEYLIPGDEKAS